MSTAPPVELVETKLATVKLGEVAKFIRGVTFKPADVTDDGSGVICLRTKNVQRDLDLFDVIRIPEHLVKRDEQYVQHGDLVVSSANSWNMVGKASWVSEPSEPMAVGGFISALRATGGQLDSRYLYWWFTSDAIQRKVRSFGRQTTNISNLNFERCLDMDIPLPPLPEQRRIAAILDQADELRVRRRRALLLLDALTARIVARVISREEWPVVRLDEIARTQGGLTVNRTRVGLSQQSEYLRVANVSRGSIDLTNVKTIGVTETEVERVALKVDDLLIVEGHGNENEVGRAARWSGDGVMVHQNHLIRVRADADRLNPTYAEAFINSAKGRGHFRSVSKTTSGLNTINMTNVKELPVRLPPIDVQRTVVSQIESIERLQDGHRAHLTKLDELFASLQHRAFSGRL